MRRAVTGLIAGAIAITAVSLLIAALKGSVDPVGLTGLYLFAILPVAIGWGFFVAGIVAVAAYLTFAYLFVTPLHSFQVAESDTAAALVISLASAFVVSELARRANERAGEARARAKEAEQAQTELRALADEQAALRRVATVVASAGATADVFEAVTREVGLQCDAELARMERFEPDDTVTAIAAWSRGGEARLAVGTRFALEGASIAAQVHETGRPARVDSFVGASGAIAREAQELGIRSSVGCPIAVGGRTWGVIAASATREAGFPRHGVANRRVHRAGGHGDRQRGGARGAAPGRRRAGCSAPRRDARRTRGPAAGRVRDGDGAGPPAAVRGHHSVDSL